MLITAVKAKYGLSNRVMAYLLDITPSQCKQHIDNDTFTDDHVAMVKRLEYVVDHMVKESELLADHTPYIESLVHDLEMLSLENRRLFDDWNKLDSRNVALTVTIKKYQTMTWLGRLIFLFNPLVPPNKINHLSPNIGVSTHD